MDSGAAIAIAFMVGIVVIAAVSAGTQRSRRQQAAPKCAHCGSPLQPDPANPRLAARFCASCRQEQPGQPGGTHQGQPLSTVRECPHCREMMRRDASVCPHCQRGSEPWIYHAGYWWSPSGRHWLDEQTGRWVPREAPVVRD